jgi:acetyltransferase-like isoleucine patch superfamily enzyme
MLPAKFINRLFNKIKLFNINKYSCAKTIYNTSLSEKTNIAYDIKFKKIGKDVHIWPMSKVVTPQNISIGDSVIVDDYVFINGGIFTNIGNFVHIASFVSITGGGEFIMEDFSGISTGCRILTGTDNFKGDWLTGPTIPSKYRDVLRSHVIIQKHATLGANTVVLPGVTIGEGTITGANSLVVTDLEPWSIYVGSPVRKIKVRPYTKIIELENKLKKELYDCESNYIQRNNNSS